MHKEVVVEEYTVVDRPVKVDKSNRPAADSELVVEKNLQVGERLVEYTWGRV